MTVIDTASARPLRRRGRRALLLVPGLLALAACQQSVPGPAAQATPPAPVPVGSGDGATPAPPPSSPAPSPSAPPTVVGATTTTLSGDTVASSPSTTAAAAAPRDAWLHPFRSDSPWNLPLSVDAQYADAGLSYSRHAFETDYLYRTVAGDPVGPMYPSASWTDRCTRNPQFPDGQPNPALTGSFHIPSALVADPPPLPDLRPESFSTPNNVVVMLQPDGRTLVQGEPVQWCDGDLMGWRAGDEYLDGIGLGGAHFGSGLSGIGGTVRAHELGGTGPIRHALKGMVWGDRHLWYEDSDSTAGYRWPATTADACASSCYNGPLPWFEMGALLALPPDTDLAALGVTHPTAVRVCEAMRDYGTYIVDDAAWDAHYIAYENGAAEAAGLTSDSAYQQQVESCFVAQQVVTNSTEETPGGGPRGGERRQPLVEPLAGE